MSDLIERDAVLEVLRGYGFNVAYMPNVTAALCAIPVVTATPTGTKPSINWAHVAPQFNWLERDVGGMPWLHEDKPKAEGGGWFSYSYCNAFSHASYTPGTCNWLDSLVMRPGHVDAGK